MMGSLEPGSRDAAGDGHSVADGLVRGRDPQRHPLALRFDGAGGQALAALGDRRGGRLNDYLRRRARRWQSSDRSINRRAGLDEIGDHGSAAPGQRARHGAVRGFGVGQRVSEDLAGTGVHGEVSLPSGPAFLAVRQPIPLARDRET